MKVINLWGGPGSGKSTMAARLFGEMKARGYSVELVTEFAKDLVWDGSNWFHDQAWITGNQNHRLEVLRGKVDYAITDSPLPLGILYTPKDYPLSYDSFVLELFDTYDNINLRVVRAHSYESNGRNQDEEEALLLDKRITKLTRNMLVTLVESTANVNDILEIIC